MIHGFADALWIPLNVLHALRHLTSFVIEPLHTIFNSVMVIFPGESVLRKVKNWELRYGIINHGMNSADKEDRSARRA